MKLTPSNYMEFFEELEKELLTATPERKEAILEELESLKNKLKEKGIIMVRE